MDERKTYLVTKLAGPKVAGVAVKSGHTIELTDREASGELLTGAIVRKGEKLAEIFDKPTPKLDAIQAAARGDDVVEAPGASPAP